MKYNYVFMTDASCDLTQKQATEAGVRVLPMEFQIEDKTASLKPISRQARTCCTQAFQRV